MALFLVQHGKSLPKDKDPEKGLSDEGVLDVKRIADAAKKYGVIYHALSTAVKKGRGRPPIYLHLPCNLNLVFRRLAE